MSYLLSIAVPTKDRYFYLEHLIELVKNFDSKEIELVIQDNTKDNVEILAYLKENSWDGLKYFHISEQIPVADNTSLAISNSSGKYVCVIGDDDGVVRNIIDYVKWMDANNVDSLRSEPPISYSWPGSKGYVFDSSAKLFFHKPEGKKKIITDFQPIRKRILRRGATEQLENPRIYCGIVRRDVLDEVYRKTGSYFPGASPDMASSMALSFVVKKHVIVDNIIVLAGSCPKSTAGMGQQHKHIGKIEEIPWLPKDTSEKWENRIPRYWTGETIYAESALKSLRRMGHEDEIKWMNYNYLYASFFVYHPGFFNLVKEYIGIRNIFGFIYSYTKIFGHRAMVFMKNYLRSKFGIKGNVVVVENLINIIECEKTIFEETAKLGMTSIRSSNSNCRYE